MQKILDYIEKIALIFGLGEMLFFALIFAPRVFTVLPRDMAAHLQAHLFPPYFNVAIVCTVALLITQKLKKRHNAPSFLPTPKRTRIAGGLLTFALLGLLYCRFQLTPEITALQNQAMSVNGALILPEEFHALHRLSVQLNGAILVAYLVLVALL